jgi:hypothetical protein
MRQFSIARCIKDAAAYERVNQLSGVCLDEQIPLAWVDNHVLIAQDMSMAAGLKVWAMRRALVSASCSAFGVLRIQSRRKPAAWY